MTARPSLRRHSRTIVGLVFIILGIIPAIAILAPYVSTAGLSDDPDARAWAQAATILLELAWAIPGSILVIGGILLIVSGRRGRTRPEP